VLTATAIGVWSLIFLFSWVFGMINSIVNKSVNYRLSHIQIHDRQFKDDAELKYYFNLENLESIVKDSMVMAYSGRIILNSMIQSPRATKGVELYGINPDGEAGLTNVSEDIIQGTYLEGAGRNPIIIGKSLAEDLKVKLRSKIVASFQNKEGDISAAAFRIVGIYETGDIILDDHSAFARIEDIRRLSGLDENEVHELAILLEDKSLVDTFQVINKVIPPELIMENYSELSPDIELYSSQIQATVIIMTVIFMLALIFGIINSMLMAVLERGRELGMLMAIGMNKVQVFFMIVFETVMLSLIGVPIGLGLGYWTVSWLGVNGINLSNWSEGLKQFNIQQIIKPELEFEYYLFVAIAVAITALLAAIYPSLKAIGLKPVEALRKI
jgi:ABC-type lipoprotein release transport system permease subunit